MLLRKIKRIDVRVAVTLVAAVSKRAQKNQ